MRARSLGPRVVVSYSGAKLSADDLIARDCEWWGARGDVSTLLVISSDKLVRRRVYVLIVREYIERDQHDMNQLRYLP